MSYLIYAKRAKEWWGHEDRKWHEPDKTFRAIDYKGMRVNKLSEAATFATKEDAEEFMDRTLKPGVEWEIRKAK